MNNPFFLKREESSAHGGVRITAATHLPRVMEVEQAVELAATLVNLAEIEIPQFVALFHKLFHHDKPAAVTAAPVIAATPAPSVAPATPAAPVAIPVAPVAPVAAPEVAKPAAVPVPVAAAPAAKK